ncbi:response regulator transcription factor [Noviherbaspirillum autotrophicum]|uniref:Transcriptional regulator n=1 Tax=Noviherbaspirillum autotrophicum TaxID=709839 RepID=A0A0C1YTG7_9BURK|nr:response regulator transcription factor [Noviherbaspirillum autotrophicum]KIF83962.1 transcriptional regulator [Noviherbaspirillum autotrophicum]
MNRPYQVLLVEDDPLIAKTLAMSLRYEGFELSLAATVREAFDALAERRFDMAMLDVGLPDGSGIDLCRDLRARDAGLPILMLSARTDEATAVAGIEGGADDYIRKPYGLKELTARMLRLLPRQRQERQTAAFGPVRIDPQRREAHAGDVVLQLGKKEFDILLLLVRAQGDAVTREQILDMFDDSSAIYDRTIDSHLSHLRKKLKDAGAAVRISAIYGVGYRMEAP